MMDDEPTDTAYAWSRGAQGGGPGDDSREMSSKRRKAAQALRVVQAQRHTLKQRLQAERRRLRNEILREASVVCGTLSAAGSKIFEDAVVGTPGFQDCIIDEAAQSIEPSSLIPLKYVEIKNIKKIKKM